jgi:hypothetical protein
MPSTTRKKNETLFFLKFSVLFTETLNAACGVDQFLFSGEKGMTLGTNFNGNILFGAPYLDRGAAGTLNGRVGIVRVDIWFHINFNSLY